MEEKKLKFVTKFFGFDDTNIISIAQEQKSIDSGGDTPDELDIRAYFTDDNLDSVGDIITKDATGNALPDYKKWRNIRFMHQPKPVGLARNIGEGDGVEGLAWNEVVIKLVDKETIKLVQTGVMKGLSVGILFNPFDEKAVEWMDSGGWKIHEYMLAEISVVDHPANPHASIIEHALKSIEGDVMFELNEKARKAIREAGTAEALVPIFKSLSAGEVVVEEDEEKELETVDEVSEELEEVEKLEEVEEEKVEEAEEEKELEDAEVVGSIEEAEALEESVETEAVVEAVETEAVTEEVEAVTEEVEEEEELLEVPEAELPIEESSEEEDEEEEVIEEEKELLENNEMEEKAIIDNEDDNMLDRLVEIEAMLAKLLSSEPEIDEATEDKAVGTLEEETEEVSKDVDDAPANRKTTVETTEENKEVANRKKLTFFEEESEKSVSRIKGALQNYFKTQ